jgi:methionyl-tRNA synthetase
MNPNQCLGCGGRQKGSVLCCDHCWSRIPRDLPEQLRWRSTLRSSRQLHNWMRVSRINDAVKRWLKENKIK